MANPNNRLDWTEDDAYWRENYRKRPYASSANQDYTYYQPGYRYGYESASRFQNRSWNDVESELSSGWNQYEHRGSSTWEHVKDAVRDAWDRVMGRHPVGTK
jgi:hypothetical protein